MKRQLLTTALTAAILAVAGHIPMPVAAREPACHATKTTELKQFTGNTRPREGKGDAEVPLWDNLLGHPFPTSTQVKEAQRYIDQAIMLTFGFNHAEAARSFRAAQALDPSCAICYWGEALVLGPNINAPMDPSANEPALAALDRAKALAAKATPREQALIAALDKRYAPAESGLGRAELDRAYADAMEDVAARFPDEDIAVLYAESLMDLSPWDYWTDGGAKPKNRGADIVATLERVLRRNPDHPGAIHLYIHAVEASDRPERAEPYADRLAGMKIGAGHLVHMPSHIYYRIGRYQDALVANRRAVATDENFFAKVAPEGLYAGGYYPHNIHFLLVSAQMAGDGATAIAAAEKLSRTVSDTLARAAPAFVQPIKAAPLFAHAQFSAPDAVLALPRPSGDFPFVDAIWHYARGVAQAALGDVEAAQQERDAIARIARTADLSGLVEGGVPAQEVLGIAANILDGRIAQAEGDWPAAVSAFRQAKSLEDQLPYMEPRHWYYPVGQSLAAALMKTGDLAGAEAAFQDSLRLAPGNGWALYGLAELYRVRGNLTEAQEIESRLKRAWVGNRSLLRLERL